MLSTPRSWHTQKDGKMNAPEHILSNIPWKHIGIVIEIYIYIYIYICIYIYDVSGLMHLVVTQVHVLSHLPWSKEMTFTSRYVQHGNTVIHENSMHVIRQIIFYNREKWFIKAHTTSLDWVASSRRERLCWRRLGATVGTDDSRGHACRTRPRATHIHE